MKTNKETYNTIIFTDLDGTLLDHDTYSFAPAKEMLNFVRTHNIPLIIVSSKTKNEILELQKSLKIFNTFVFENGAGIYICDQGVTKTLALGFDIHMIRKSFAKYKKKIAMQGFSDMSLEEIVTLTGLNPKKAQAARERLFTEPFVLEDEDQLETLQQMAHTDGLNVVAGGRFYHLITEGQDKAKAIEVVKDFYEQKYQQNFTTIALGDSPNDLSMLQSVDNPILIPHPDGSYMSGAIKNLTKAKFPGPSGWNQALRAHFDVL
ncbi:HAD-IIB family hydrolase [Sulfurospirillum sp. 1612]|uniref:HAD-IIB family hydrolase n=1 Tax=Sulfurospirillum sp. 1612 TaxID=3094835 RepID=UPI002F95579E